MPGVRGLHLGSFTEWDPHAQTELIKARYGFKPSPVKFDRTYRVGSNLDDMHENGIHDWLKYIKFGYGRATDHGSKDIRLGVMEREAVLSLARQLDSVLPNDLDRWLEYTKISRDLFFYWQTPFDLLPFGPMKMEFGIIPKGWKTTGRRKIQGHLIKNWKF